jgi:LL-diaminopimelate aminotransferase
MVQVNGNYLKLKAGYLFPEIARRVKAFSDAHPEAAIIRLGIGDVTEPLPEACRAAMKAAIDEMGTREGFHGYGPEQGYAWLREAIATHDFQARGCQVSAEEIFVSDGSKCDSANILDILGEGNRIAVTDPVYPVYVDSNVMAGRTGEVDGALRRPHLFADQRRERLHRPDSLRTGGPDLPLLPQQPHRSGGHQGATPGLGDLRPLHRGPDSV